MPSISPNSSSIPKVGAFTLVEVLLAMSLAGTALLAMVSLLNTALGTVRDAGRVTISSEIARQLSARLQASPWQISGDGEIGISSSWSDRVRYFDQQGTELSQDEESRAVYSALVTLEPVGTTLPGAQPNPFSRMLRVAVVDGPARSRSWFLAHPQPTQMETLRTVVTSRKPIPDSAP